MKIYALVLFLLVNSNLFAQQVFEYKTTITYTITGELDSAVFNSVININGNFIIHQWPQNDLWVWDEESLYKIHESPKIAQHRSIGLMAYSDEVIFLFRNNKNFYFNHYRYNGGKNTVKLKFDKKSYVIPGIKIAARNIYYIEKHGIYLAAINSKVKSKDFESFCRAFYEVEGNIGIFNQQGKLIKAFGTYPDIYRQGCIDYRMGHNFFFDDEKELIYLVTDASPVIHIYNLSGEFVGEFGKEGLFANTPEKYPVYDNENNISNELHFLIETPSYSGFHHDKVNHLFFRFYRPAIEDTLIEKKPGYIVINSQGSSKMCIPDSHLRQAQFDLLNSKPVYVQVYDEDYNLIYDGPSGELRNIHYSDKGIVGQYLYEDGKIVQKEYVININLE